MLLLLMLLPLGGLELLAIPTALWLLGPTNWHPAIALVCGAGAVAFAVSAARLYRQGSAKRRAVTTAAGDWRWPRGVSAAQYRIQIELFYRLRGWRIDGSDVHPDGRVALTIYKDRWSVTLLLAGPGQAAIASGDLARADAERRRTHAAHAVFAAPSRVGSDLRSAPSGGAVHLLRLRDLPHLETVLGPVGLGG